MTRLEEIAATEPNIDDTEYLLDLVRRLCEAGEAIPWGITPDCECNICATLGKLRSVIAEAKR